ncbi:MAG: hypothetical protein Q4G51_04100 [Dermatophilus congolensis]|nr:hypothetical protein [Dermatophilus congolensis]
MNVEPGRGALLVAGTSLIGAAVGAIAAGWDRWSYCWDRGTYWCIEAQNDPPAPGVLSDWHEEALASSWALLGVAFLVVAFAVRRLHLASVGLLAAGAAGAFAVGLSEITDVVPDGGLELALYLSLVWYFAIGLVGLAVVPMFDWGETRIAPLNRVWGWVIVAVLAMTASTPLFEFFVLVGIDGSHDTPTLMGILRGVLFVVAAVCLFVAALLRREAPGPQDTFPVDRSSSASPG